MELDPEARRILDLTREGRSPSAGDKARIESLLGAAVGFATLPALASTSVAPGAKVTAAALALKWGGVTAFVAAALALGGGAAYYWKERGAASRPTPSVAAPPTPAGVVAEDRAVAPANTGPTRVGAAAPGAEEVSPRPSGTESRRPSAGSTLGAELDLLHEVQARWRGGDANGALSLLAVHRERYPHSQLGPEREALRVLCLCATGRTDEARRIGRRFLTNAPRSPLRTSVEESCAGK